MVGAGIDGCRAGWLVIHGTKAKPQALVCSTFEAVLKAVPLGNLIVDMPIGLTEADERRVEKVARQWLPGRTGSVFSVPARSAVYAEDYLAACSANEISQGKKISKQAWFLCPKIREIDGYLRKAPALRGRLFEGHPELAFALLAGAPMVASKKSALGQAARRQLLESRGLAVSRLETEVFQRYRKSAVAVDDVLDAAVLFSLVIEGSEPFLTKPIVDEEGLEVNYRVPQRQNWQVSPKTETL